MNLFKVGRSKAIIFVNDKTLYSFVLYGVRKNNSSNLAELFMNGLLQLLKIDGFNDSDIVQLVGSSTELAFTKTNSRKVLGNINDLIFHYQASVGDAGGFEYADIGAIIHRVNRMPQRNIGWGYSIDAVKNMLKNA